VGIPCVSLRVFAQPILFIELFWQDRYPS
jgi:hypothetical protein